MTGQLYRRQFHTAAEKAGAKFLNSLRNDYRLQFGIGEGSLLYRRNTFRDVDRLKVAAIVEHIFENGRHAIRERNRFQVRTIHEDFLSHLGYVSLESDGCQTRTVVESIAANLFQAGRQ